MSCSCCSHEWFKQTSHHSHSYLHSECSSFLCLQRVASQIGAEPNHLCSHSHGKKHATTPKRSWNKAVAQIDFQTRVNMAKTCKTTGYTVLCPQVLQIQCQEVSETTGCTSKIHLPSVTYSQGHHNWRKVPHHRKHLVQFQVHQIPIGSTWIDVQMFPHSTSPQRLANSW